MTDTRPTTAAERRIAPGCELFTPFAQGGMATVYLGRWTSLGGFTKVVAIKALHPHTASDRRLSDMLRDEARMAARIHHPGVLTTIDVVDHEGEVFVVMDYVHGATLSQLVRAATRAGEPVPVDVALHIMSDTLHGLHAAHEALDEKGRALEIVHRDVSPQNILVGVDGHARLIDFGVARALNRITSTRTGEIKGKMSYLAPEQLLDDGIDRRTDVYGAAVVTWQLLTGRKLFEQSHFSAIATAILRSEIEPPSAHAPDIPPALDDIVMRGLARDPGDRFATAEEMAGAIDDLAVSAPPRRVGAWVSHTARERIAEMAALVRDVQQAPASGDAPPSTPRPSLSDPEVIELSKTMPPQPSRTQLTSLAEATPSTPGTPTIQWVAVLTAAALAGAIWISAIQRTASVDHAQASSLAPNEGVVSAPDLSDLEPAPPEPEVSASPAASASATTTPRAAAPPPGEVQKPKAKAVPRPIWPRPQQAPPRRTSEPRRRLPDGI